MKHLDCPIRQTAVTHSGCRCSKGNGWTRREGTRGCSWLIPEPAERSRQQRQREESAGFYEQQHPWSCFKTPSAGALPVAKKHFIWFFILLITAGSVARRHGLVYRRPEAFMYRYRLPGGGAPPEVVFLLGPRLLFLQRVVTFSLCLFMGRSGLSFIAELNSFISGSHMIS